MARIVIIRNTYGGVEYLKRVLNYVRDGRALSGGGYGVDPYDPEIAYNQMMQIRRYFNKISGNPLVHIVVAYSQDLNSLEQATIYGDAIARMFADRFQVLYCTHHYDNNCDWYHTHIIVNSVSYINGAMIETGYDEMSSFSNIVSRLLGEYCQFYFDNKNSR